MDFPMNLFASSMAQRRPSSKVIMTVRPPEEWLSSWANINDIMSLLVARPWAWLVDMTFNQQLLKARSRFSDVPHASENRRSLSHSIKIIRNKHVASLSESI